MTEYVAAILLEQIRAIRDLTRLVELKDGQLAVCTRIMREVAGDLRTGVIDDLEILKRYEDAEVFTRMADALMQARSGR